jgi:hypothetical protein
MRHSSSPLTQTTTTTNNRDVGVTRDGRHLISGGDDGYVFVSNAELIVSSPAVEKHNWRGNLNTEISSVSFHPTQQEVVSVTTDEGAFCLFAFLDLFV